MSRITEDCVGCSSHSTIKSEHEIRSDEREKVLEELLDFIDLQWKTNRDIFWVNREDLFIWVEQHRSKQQVSNE
jgi:hypothetical protein